MSQAALKRWGWPTALAACVLAAGLASLASGLDTNWDLRNYHYYDPFAFLEGRLAWDIAPAQIQTYHNPLLDLAFYGLAREVDSPRVIAVAMALPAGVTAFLLLRMLAALFPRGMGDRWVWIAVAFAIGMTGSSGRAVLGTTMDEWPPAMLLMGSLSAVVASTARRGSPTFAALAFAGFAAGLAMGLKLTYGMFALGVVVASGARGGWREAVKGAALTGLCVLAGLAITYGFWGSILWREFGNPFFPYFNDVFRSPWWEPTAWFDRRFGPRDGLQAVLFPFYFAQRSLLVGEVGFRDWRLAALMALAIGALVRRGFDRGSGAPPVFAPRAAWIFLGVFTIASYAAWLALYAIYRYLVPLEMLSGPLMVGCALYTVRGAMARRAALFALAVLVIGTTRKPDWGHLPFRGAYFDVVVPEILPRALVILGPGDPMAYAIPFFRRDARFVSPQNNFLGLGQENRLARRAAELIATHPGPLYSLDMKGVGRTQPVLAHFGLVRDEAACITIRSNLDSDAMQVCRLSRGALYDSDSARSVEGGKK